MPLSLVPSPEKTRTVSLDSTESAVLMGEPPSPTDSRKTTRASNSSTTAPAARRHVTRPLRRARIAGPADPTSWGAEAGFVAGGASRLASD